MQHTVLWCHGQLQDEKSVPKAASLNPWPDGTKICKTLVLSEDFLNEVNISANGHLCHKATFAATDRKRAPNLNKGASKNNQDAKCGAFCEPSVLNNEHADSIVVGNLVIQC